MDEAHFYFQARSPATHSVNEPSVLHQTLSEDVMECSTPSQSEKVVPGGSQVCPQCLAGQGVSFITDQSYLLL